jgi:membrane-associated phospholipid phosphatase
MRGTSPRLSSTSDRNTTEHHRALVVAACALALLIAAFVPVSMCNPALFSAINGLHSHYSDPVWLGLTTLGDGFLLVIVLGACGLINPRVTVLGLILMLVASMFVHAIKWAVPVSRPVEALGYVHVIGPTLRHGSFPSGHAGAVFAAALGVVHYSSCRLTALFIVMGASLVGLSRIFVGAHFPLDVLGGVACALTAFLLVLSTFWSRVEPRIPSALPVGAPGYRCFVGLEIAASLFGLFVYAPFFAESPPVAAVVALAVLAFLAFRVRLRVSSAP